MNNYSEKSFIRLCECHPDLQRIFMELLKSFDHSIYCGYRDQESQDKYYKEGKSNVIYPHSKHNRKPSLAIDVAPYPRGNNSRNDRLLHFIMAGQVQKIAYDFREKEIIKSHIRWGGNWDGDRQFDDQNLFDLQHFEIV